MKKKTASPFKLDFTILFSVLVTLVLLMFAYNLYLKGKDDTSTPPTSAEISKTPSPAVKKLNLKK